MSVNVAIRRLRSDDAASFKAIRLQALTANPELLRSTLELEDKLDLTWFASRLEDAHVAGAFRGGELVGTAGFSVQQGAPNAHKGRLFSMYVRPDLRNVGIGRRLLSEIVARAEALGRLQMLAIIGDSGNAASIGLHAALGFRQIGILQSIGFKFGRWVDTVVMQRALGAGDSVLPKG